MERKSWILNSVQSTKEIQHCEKGRGRKSKETPYRAELCYEDKQQKVSSSKVAEDLYPIEKRQIEGKWMARYDICKLLVTDKNSKRAEIRRVRDVRQKDE